jgi:hypothetical protein
LQLSTSSVISPGTVLSECAVVRLCSNVEGEPYEVHFHAQGRQYACPLYAFLPRTDAWYGEVQSVAEDRAAIAV